MKRLTVIVLLLFAATTLFSQVNHYTVGTDNKVSGSVHVGDVITFANGSKGVVFYVNPDRTGGWVVKTTDGATNTPWAYSTNSDVQGLANITAVRTLLEDVDGYANTVKMRTLGATGSHAVSSAGLNPIMDFDNGWYLPAAGQMRKLVSMLPILESLGLSSSDFTTLNRNANGYWTSTEYNGSRAWTVIGVNTGTSSGFEANSGGQFYSQAKNASGVAVRAVHDFVMEEGTYSYLWNTGATTPEITVTPNETTEYCVTVTYGGQCSTTECDTITVSPDTHNVIYDTVCDSYTWHGQTYSSSGVYTYLDPNAGPCQGADTLYLTVNHGTEDESSETVCESYTWETEDGWDTLIMASGTYYHHYSNAYNCPSLATLHLTVNHGTDDESSETVCESYTWETEDGWDTLIMASGTYYHHYNNELHMGDGGRLGHADHGERNLLSPL